MNEVALLGAGIAGKRLGSSAVGGNGLAADIAGSVGAFALQYAVGSLLPSQKIRQEGSRLADVQQTYSSYGTTIPIVFGDAVVGGNIIWTPENGLVEEARASTTGSSKGAGQAQVTTITYLYFFNGAVGICEGTIRGIKRIWCQGQLIFDEGKWLIDGSTTAYQLYDDTPDEGVYIAPGVRLYFGTETQLPCPLIESYEGAGRVSAHRGMAYVVFENFPMEKFGNGSQLLEFKFEVSRYVAVEAPLETTADLPADANIPPKAEWQYDYDQLYGTLAFRVSGTQDYDTSVSYGQYQDQPLYVQRSTDTGLVIDTVELPSLMGFPSAQFYEVRSKLVVSSGYAYLVFGNTDTCENYLQIELSLFGNHQIVSGRLPGFELGELLTLNNGGLPEAFRPHTLSGYKVGLQPRQPTLNFPYAYRRYVGQRAGLHGVDATLVLLDIVTEDPMDFEGRIERTELGYETAILGNGVSGFATSLEALSADSLAKIARVCSTGWTYGGVPNQGYILVIGNKPVQRPDGSAGYGGGGQLVLMSASGAIQAVRNFTEPDVAIPGMAPFIDYVRNRLVYPGAVLNFWEL